MADFTNTMRLLTHYGEHYFFLSALCATSDSLTGRQRKDLPRQGRRVKSGHVSLKRTSPKHLEK